MIEIGNRDIEPGTGRSGLRDAIFRDPDSSDHHDSEFSDSESRNFWACRCRDFSGSRFRESIVILVSGTAKSTFLPFIIRFGQSTGGGGSTK